MIFSGFGPSGKNFGSVMLSERDKKDLMEMASSAELREEFRTLRLRSRPSDPREMDLDELIRFLNAASRMAPVEAPRNIGYFPGTFRL